MKPILIATALIAALVAALVVTRRQTDSFKVLAPLKSPIGSEAADRATLDQLKRAGADLSKPTKFLFYLYLPEQELAMKAAERARTTTLSASVDRVAEGSSWRCLVKGQMVPTLAAIHAESKRLSDVATSLGGEYDGWEAAVTR